MKLSNLNAMAAAMFLAGSLGAVSAKADGLYVGGALGTPSYQDDVNGISGSGSGLSGKVFGGYQLTPNFALEAGVADFGHIENSSGKVNGGAGYIDAVAIAPLTNQWALLGSLGIAHARFNTTEGDGSGNGLKVGAGAQYAVSSTIAIRAEWERYQPHVFDTRPNVDQYTLGVRASF
jgi:OmpA-OmpF porin, OOP family